jgi:3-isopropylmalate/(R)-2-methylmalate dehydratase small subunit
MEKFDKLSAIAAPLMRQNIDTDMVIRVEARDLPPEKLGPCLQPVALQARRQRGASSCSTSRLIATPRSSLPPTISAAARARAAVWSLFASASAAIAPRSGRSSTTTASRTAVARGGAAPGDRGARERIRGKPGHQQGVDRQACTITSPSGKVTPFKIDALRREALLAGLDQIEQTRHREKEIASFETGDRQRFPWLYQQA